MITPRLMDKCQLVILNNKNNQLFISFFKNFKFIKCFSTGYILSFLKIFKKNLRRKVSSFILQLKMVLNIIEKCFIDNFFIFNIKGTKKNFFKWLNFLKIKISNFKVIVYLYTPNIHQTPLKIKKVRAIKKRLKKKYLYQEGMI
jgi:hypothetical protein